MFLIISFRKINTLSHNNLFTLGYLVFNIDIGLPIVHTIFFILLYCFIMVIKIGCNWNFKRFSWLNFIKIKRILVMGLIIYFIFNKSFLNFILIYRLRLLHVNIEIIFSRHIGWEGMAVFSIVFLMRFCLSSKSAEQMFWNLVFFLLRFFFKLLNLHIF